MKKHFKNFDYRYLTNIIPTYAMGADADINGALSHIKNESMFCTNLKEFYESILKSADNEIDIYKKFGYNPKKSALMTCFNILFGPLEDVPMYIGLEGYKILAEFRLKNENKKADSLRKPAYNNKI